ncbi:hypothetical protein [Microbacterium oxydans]|uniref:hypothetical protein n=1 Tax=Microbacterium oxydans TaxID=82380 RepID=UPI0037CC9DBC
MAAADLHAWLAHVVAAPYAGASEARPRHDGDMASSTHGRDNEVEGASVAGDARLRLREHRYADALVLVREALTNYLGYSDPRTGWIPTRFLLGSQYGRLAAAFGDGLTLDLMDQVVERMAAADPEGDSDRWRTEVAGYRVDLDAMNALRVAVTATDCGILVKELNSVATRAKSRLAWLEKAGAVHIIADTAYAGPAEPVDATAEAAGNVPVLRSYYSSLDDLDTEEQQDFYERFTASVCAGEPLDLEGNISYGFILLREATSRRLDSRRDAAFLANTLRSFTDVYAGTSLGMYSQKWLADLEFLSGDFEGGYRLFGPAGPDMELYINLAPFLSDSRITPEMVDCWLGQSQGLTEFGKKRKQDVSAHLAVILEALHDELNQSTLMDLWNRLSERRRAGLDLLVESELDGFLRTDELVNRLASVNLNGGYARPREAFFGMPALMTAIQWPAEWTTTAWFEWIASEWLRSLYRQAENALRQAEGLNAVGEGWVSEVALLNELRTAFPHEHVVHQGRPHWLRPQSLDVYFPQREVAIEYQGLQHSEPVGRFGGAEAFERQQERDRRKRELCVKHGVSLIEVHPGYDPHEVIKQVRKALASR